MKNLFLAITLLLGTLFWASSVNAQTTIPDETEKTSETAKKSDFFFDGLLPSEKGDSATAQKIREGTLRLTDMPYMLVKWMDFFAKLAGTFSVIMMLWGGFQYVVSGLTEEKESAKNTIKYALIGLAVTFWAWIGINMLQIHLTVDPTGGTTTEQSS